MSDTSDTSDMDAYAGPPPTLPISMTPAGWYPQSGELRYWDGYQWTEHRAPLPASQVAIPAGYAPAYQHQQYATFVTDARTNPVEITVAWIFTVLSIGYMLPWAIAATRGKSNSWAVGLVNFLLGWTLIGWVVALVMACTAHHVTAVRTH